MADSLGEKGQAGGLGAGRPWRSLAAMRSSHCIEGDEAPEQHPRSDRTDERVADTAATPQQLAC